MVYILVALYTKSLPWSNFAHAAYGSVTCGFLHHLFFPFAQHMRRYSFTTHSYHFRSVLFFVRMSFICKSVRPLYLATLLCPRATPYPSRNFHRLHAGSISPCSRSRNDGTSELCTLKRGIASGGRLGGENSSFWSWSSVRRSKVPRSNLRWQPSDLCLQVDG